MDEQKKILVIFTEKADIVLSDIIKRYSLQETEAEAFEKYEKEKLPKIVVLDHLTRDFVLKILSEKDLVNSLQKELEIPQQTAEKISKDIITGLIPLLEKIPEDELENYNLKNQPNSNYDNTAALEIKKNIPAPLKELKGKSALPFKKIKNPALPAAEEIKKPAPQSTQPKGPDNYREPIE